MISPESKAFMNGISGLIERDPRRLSVVTNTSDNTKKGEAGGSQVQE